MKNQHRVLSLLLAIAMIVSMFTITAAAAEQSYTAKDAYAASGRSENRHTVALFAWENSGAVYIAFAVDAANKQIDSAKINNVDARVIWSASSEDDVLKLTDGTDVLWSGTVKQALSDYDIRYSNGATPYYCVVSAQTELTETMYFTTSSGAGGFDLRNRGKIEVDIPEMDFGWKVGSITGTDSRPVLGRLNTMTTPTQAQAQAAVKVYLGVANGTDVSGLTELSYGTASALREQITAQGFTIVVSDGYQIDRALICCNDDGGYDCNTAESGNAGNLMEMSLSPVSGEAVFVYKVTAADIADYNSANPRAPFFHNGAGTPSWLMISLIPQYHIYYFVDGTLQSDLTVAKDADADLTSYAHPTYTPAAGRSFSGWTAWKTQAAASSSGIDTFPTVMPNDNLYVYGTTSSATVSLSYEFYDADGGTLPPAVAAQLPASESVNINSTKSPLPNNFTTVDETESGVVVGTWSFVGWHAVKNDDTSITSVDIGTSNVTVYGEWVYTEAQAYTVSYRFTSTENPDGKTAPTAVDYIPGAPVSVHSGWEEIDVYDSTNTYVIGTWSFSGWDTDDASVSSGSFNMPGNDVEFTGEWTYSEAETYNVTYHLVGTVKPTDDWSVPTDANSYYAGQTVDVIAQSNVNETYGYYTFDGWYTDEAMTLAAGAGVAMPAGGLHLYGSWRWVQTVIPTSSFSFSKVDRFGLALNGARFGLYTDSACKNLISTAVSMSKGNGIQTEKGIVTFDNIPVQDATYYLKEISAPRGYVTSDDVYEVRVRASDDASIDVRVRLVGASGWTTVSRLRIVNLQAEKETGSVRISKEISGKIYSVGNKQFVFNIYDAWGELAGATQMTAGQTKVVDLEPGVYTITEANPELSGYSVKTYINGAKLPDVSVVVRVEEGKVVDVDYENVYELDIDLNIEDHYAYIVGYPDGTVGPNNAITRAEVATIFFRMLTDDAREHYYSITNSFTDVDSSDWFNVAVSTLSKAGVLTGYEDGSFQPNRSITRAELVTIAMSFFDFVEENSEELFTDVAGHWADASINFAAQLGIVTGYGDGTFAPDKTITRAETITIINRVLYRAPHDNHLLPQMTTWSDNKPGTWYYAQVQEATNSHTYSWTIVNGARYEDWEGLLPVRDWAAIERAWTQAYLAGDYGEVMDD